MEEPFYGNGAGVQINLPFEGETTAAQAAIISCLGLAHYGSAERVIEAWAYCSRRRVHVSACRYPSDGLLEKELREL